MSKMTAQERSEGWLIEVQDHLRDDLLPFWRVHGSDETHGGFGAAFDDNGLPVAVREKTLLSQVEMLYTFCAIEREGFATGDFLDRARIGLDFLLDHFWDDTHGGWYWSTNLEGVPIDDTKSLYAQAFAALALSEYGMASGDHRGAEWATNTFQTIQTFCADNSRGGYFDFFQRDWTRASNTGTKSFAAHVRLMQGLNNLYESTGASLYREKALELAEVIRSRLIHPQYATAITRTDSTWRVENTDPWAAYRLATRSASDSIHSTVSGLNAEYTCHINQLLRLVDVDPQPYMAELLKTYRHIADRVIDSEQGGAFDECLNDSTARSESQKADWTQGECMIAMLDAYRITEDLSYLDCYEHVHRFVMDHMISHAKGDWRALVTKEHVVIEGDANADWKTCYSAMRAMIQCESRLLKLAH